MDIQNVEKASALSSASFRHYIASRFISSLGDGIYFIFAVWWIKTTLNSDHLIALLALLISLPRLFLGALSGGLADRSNRIRLIIACDVLSALMLIVVLLLFQNGNLTFLALALSGVILSILDTISFPAYEAVVPQILTKDQLSKSNAMRRVVVAIAEIAGPMIGGLLVAKVGSAVTILINLLSFLISAMLVSRISIKFEDKVKERSQSYASDMIEGVSYVRKDSTISSIIGLTFGFLLFTSMIFVLLPGIAKDVLGTDAFGFGLLEAALPLGFLAGGIIIMAFDRYINGTIIILCLLLTAFGRIGLSLSTSLPLSIFCLGVSGIGVAITAISFTTVIQERVPNDLLGRVFGFVDTAIELARPLGYALLGLMLVLVKSSQNVVLVAGLGTLVIALLAALVPGIRRINSSSLDKGGENL